jgi:hypothetical protein
MSQPLLFSEYVLLMSDLLPIFNDRGIWWKRCEGPGNLTGLTAAELLPLVQPLDPIWDADLLATVLRNGLRLGTLKQSPPGFYFGNAEMLTQNEQNTVFEDVVPSLCQPRRVFTRQPFVTY